VTTPLRFVKEGFLWGKGELEGWDGPDAWQAETLATIGEEVRKRDFNGIHPVDPIRMATASGHGDRQDCVDGLRTPRSVPTPHMAGVDVKRT
jgi:hypothetical protein